MPFRPLNSGPTEETETILSVSEEGTECRGLAGLGRDTVEKRQDSEAAQGLQQGQETAAATLRLVT